MDLINVTKKEEMESHLFNVLREELKKQFPEVVKKGNKASNTDLITLACYVIGFLELKEKGGDNK